MHQVLTRGLAEFNDPNSEAQLHQLEELLSSVEPSACGQPEFDALLQLYERFPEHDGFGVFWSVLHFLEACSGYEEALVRSVLREPVEFNLTMVNRLLNAGTHEINGQSLVALLISAEQSSEAGERAKQVARHFIEHFAAHGGAGA
jgi:hypothetical protein